MAAPAVIRPATVLAGPVATRRVTALAVVELEDWGSAGDGTARLLAAGRPADDQWSVRPAE